MSADFYVTAYEWHCGDDVCDCVQPIVEVRSCHTWMDYRWKLPYRVAEGPFLSYGYGLPENEEIKESKKWLEDAKSWYHLEKE